MKHRPLIKWIPTALLGLTLAGTLGVNHAAAQEVTNTIILTDFDNSPSWTWGYGYDYSWGGTAPPTGNWAYAPLFSEVTNVCYAFWFTNVPYQALVEAGGHYGIGF